MHRLAIFSDIHANLPALTAVLADIESRSIDSIYCLGDLVDFAPWPNEVIELIRLLHIPTLMGNHDERIAFDLPIVPLAKHPVEETAARIEAIAYTREEIAPENKRYLAGLPRQIHLTFSSSVGDIRILLTHASPRSIDEYVFENHPAEDLLPYFQSYQADVLVMGHTHLSYVRPFPPGELSTFSRFALNTGSVGRTKEVIPHATYLLLTVHDTGVDAEIISVAYPVRQVIRAIRQSGIPDFYADFLERAMLNGSRER
jgi:predicted phosphodiesterase